MRRLLGIVILLSLLCGAIGLYAQMMGLISAVIVVLGVCAAFGLLFLGLWLIETPTHRSGGE